MIDTILDDFRDFFTVWGKMLFRSNSRKSELVQGVWDVDLRTLVRKTAFSLLVVGGMILLPLAIFLTFIDYPSAKSDMSWGYWFWFILFYAGVYILAVYFTPRIRSARTAYLHRALVLFPFYLFCIGFGQVVSFLVIPRELFYWYVLFHLPVIIYSPILFRKKSENLKSIIDAQGVRWKIKKNPIWDYREYLPRHGERGLGAWGGLFYSIFVTIIFYFLVDIHRYFSYDVGNIIRLGIVNAALLYYFVGSIYQNILIAHMLTELEVEIDQPILLE